MESALLSVLPGDSIKSDAGKRRLLRFFPALILRKSASQTRKVNYDNCKQISDAHRRNGASAG